MGTQTPRVGMRPFTAVLLRATLVALLVATGIGPSAPLRAQTPADRTNHIRNSSVETDTKGWNKYTNDDTLKVDYSRDTQLGFDGTASLRQDIAISDDIGKDAAAAWVYEIRINPKWWGKPVSASMEAWTSDVALEPTIVVQFWQSDKLIHAYTEESRATSGSATGAWVRHELSGVDVLEGTTEIRFICRARVLTKGTTGTVWYDAMVLEQAEVAGPYLSGGESTPAGNAASPVASPVSQGSPPATVPVVLPPTATSTPLPTATTVPPTATATMTPAADRDVDSGANGNQPTIAQPNADPRTDAHAGPDRDADPHTDGHEYFDADGNANTEADRNFDCDASAHRYEDSATYGNQHASTDRHAHSDPDSDADAGADDNQDGTGNAYTDSHGYQFADRDSHAYANFDGHRHCHKHCNVD